MFVIKFNKKYYWCGYNTVSDQIRKAVIYKSKKMAIDVAEDCKKRVKGLEQPISYEIIEVEIREK